MNVSDKKELRTVSVVGGNAWATGLDRDVVERDGQKKGQACPKLLRVVGANPKKD